MRILLSSDQKFWLGIGAVVLIVLGLLFLWALPTHRASGEAKAEWSQAVMVLNALKHDHGNIPSLEALGKSGEYREWVEKQANLVETFFADRTALLAAPLTGEGEVSRGDFKEAYHQAVARQIEYLQNNARRMTVPDPNHAFRMYPWLRTADLPDPKGYDAILREYWARYYLYRLFLDTRVRVVKKLDIGSVVHLPGEFDGLQFRASLSVMPDRMSQLFEKTLAVSADIASMPVFDLSDISVTAEPSAAGATPLCSVLINGHILLQRKSKAGGKG